MKRREFLKNGMAITALAATSPLLLSGVAKSVTFPDATRLFVVCSGQNAALFRGERILIDYCTAKSFKTPHFSQSASTYQSSIPGERLPMFEL